MTQLNLLVNSLPRDLLEFTFFLAVGFTAGSVGLIQFTNLVTYNIFNSSTSEPINESKFVQA